MRVMILAQPDSWYARDLIRAAGADCQLQLIAFERLTARIVGCQRTVGSDTAALSGADAVIVRTMPPGSLEQVVFRMDALAALESTGVLVVNSPKAMEAAVDKYLTTLRLSQSGVPVPDSEVAQSAEEAMQAFETLGMDVVVKPLFGSEGRGIVRVSDADLAYRAFRVMERNREVIYMQRFISHPGFDVRILRIGDEAFAISRHHDDDWRTNIARGGWSQAYKASEREMQIAHDASAAVGASISGVDLIQDREGNLFVLEVNAVPGWRALAKTLNVDIAARVLDFCRRSLR